MKKYIKPTTEVEKMYCQGALMNASGVKAQGDDLFDEGDLDYGYTNKNSGIEIDSKGYSSGSDFWDED